MFVESAMTRAAVDRQVHHSTILEMNVESYRRRAAQSAGGNTPRKNAEQVKVKAQQSDNS
jgi:hypothetical protein